MSCSTHWPEDDRSQEHRRYAKQLLEPGWLGYEPEEQELAYIRQHLKGHKRVAELWGFRWPTPQRPRLLLPMGAVRLGASQGDPEDRALNEALVHQAWRESCGWRSRPQHGQDTHRRKLAPGLQEPVPSYQYRMSLGGRK